eukprot:snap_masked-scaffold_25-processed-gene-4.27-mRNA-1 protein AED:1.00 eAED:1.00 QI:0/0/0/0/1/1/2/0/365
MDPISIARKAKSAFEEKSYEECIQLANFAISSRKLSSSDSIFLTILLSKCYIELKDYTNGESTLKSILKEKPEHMPSITLLISVYKISNNTKGLLPLVSMQLSILNKKKNYKRLTEELNSLFEYVKKKSSFHKKVFEVLFLKSINKGILQQSKHILITFSPDGEPASVLEDFLTTVIEFVSTFPEFAVNELLFNFLKVFEKNCFISMKCFNPSKSIAFLLEVFENEDFNSFPNIWITLLISLILFLSYFNSAENYSSKVKNLLQKFGTVLSENSFTLTLVHCHEALKSLSSTSLDNLLLHFSKARKSLEEIGSQNIVWMSELENFNEAANKTKKKKVSKVLGASVLHTQKKQERTLSLLKDLFAQ